MRRGKPGGSTVGAAVLALALVFGVSGSSQARPSWFFEGFVGGVHNFGTPLTLRQQGRPAIEIDARYETRPFELPLYYSLRIGIERERGGWEVQFTHHKLYLIETTQEVQHFEITHGYNLLTFNRAFATPALTLRAGAGLVLAHPESEVRHEASPGHYAWTGPVLLLGAGRRFELSSRFFLSAELQWVYARAKVPIANGTATAPSAALHALIGWGLRF